MITSQHRPARSRWQKFRRWLRNLGIGLLVLALLGVVYQQVGLAVGRQPAPGELIPVGPHRLHLFCQGSGSPTVILESGSGIPSPFWSLVQQEIAAFTRVCAYDRAGYGWSDPATNPRTGEQIVAELHQVLQAAEVEGPVVLVAHSLGGMYSRLYANRHPNRVAGMVLVDARHEDVSAALAAAGVVDPNPAATATVSKILVHLGIARLVDAVWGLDRLTPGMENFDSLPETARAQSRYLLLRPQQFGAQAAEGQELPELEAALRSAGDLDSLPLVVLAQDPTRAAPGPAAGIWQESQRKLAALSTRGRLEVVAGAGHMILLDRPEAVVAATRAVVTAARQ